MATETVTNNKSIPFVKEFIRKLRRTSRTENILTDPKPAKASTSSQSSNDDNSVLTAAEAAYAELGTMIASLKASQSTFPNKRKVLDTAHTLIRAVQGPFQNVMTDILTMADHSILGVFVKFRMLYLLPATSYEIAYKTGIAVQNVDRILRFVETYRIIKEDEDGVWTATKEADPYFISTVSALIEIVLIDFKLVPMSLQLFLEKHPMELRTGEGPIKFVLGKDLWELCRDSPEIQRRIATLMEGYAFADQAIPVIDKWLREDSHPTGKFLDVGGGNGHVSTALAKIAPPGITFEVQDINNLSFKERLPSVPPEIQKRVSFRHHDFFTPQPKSYETEPVNAIFIRRAIHDWSDEDSVRILRHFIPVMEHDPERRTALLINETILPEKGTLYRHEEQYALRADVFQWLMLNTRERSVREWKQLLKMTDPRLELQNVLWEDRSEGFTNMGLLVIRLKRD